MEDALTELAHHNIYGYTNTQAGDGFFEAVAGWMKRHHNWEVQPEWHVKTPGVCVAIANAIRAVTEPGDAVLINQPVYYPFSNIILQNGRKRVSSDLVCGEDGSYSIDFQDFEQKIVENQVKLFILCNPHNPVGRVWTKEELLRIGTICREHQVLVFSDEIHFDFIWSGEHHVFQEVDSAFREFTMTATAPSKTFNLAGLQQSNIFIPNEKIRKAFIHQYQVSGLDEPNTFGIAATQAAYNHGDEWYEAMKKYVWENICYAKEFIDERIPDVKMNLPEGTYLFWLDFRKLGLSADELEDLIIHKAGLWLDSGRIFGTSGEGFQRMNAACQRSTLQDALERIEKAL